MPNHLAIRSSGSRGEISFTLEILDRPFNSRLLRSFFDLFLFLHGKKRICIKEKNSVGWRNALENRGYAFVWLVNEITRDGKGSETRMQREKLEN